MSLPRRVTNLSMDQNTRRIYLTYFRIGDNAYREKVRFYEENRDAISQLHYEERFEVDLDYLLSLFEMGRYERYLQKADPLIEQVIEDNIFYIRGENIYNELLFRKAACYYHLQMYDRCKTLLRQLIRMDRKNPLYTGLYTICNRKTGNDIYELVKASSMAAFILVVSITVASILCPPVLQQYILMFVKIRMILIGYALGSLVAIELYFQYKMYKDTGMVSFRILQKIFG